MTARVAGRLGTIDRGIRLAVAAAFLLGAALCPWAAAVGLWMQILFAAVGVVAGWTALRGSCPLYRLLGICTG